MFQIGDFVAHYREGVCEVTAIGKLDMRCSDREKDYYTLKPVFDTGGILYTPVDNEKNQVRELITTEEAKELIQGIPEIEPIQVSDEKKREELYKEALMKNECRSWAAVVKTSYQRKMNRLSSGKKVIHVDDKYFNMAEQFLSGELAVVLQIPRNEVQQYIQREIENER